jgi:hypothetical protein
MAQVLLDQNVPVGVRRILGAHDVHTAYQMGWAGLLNGDLLDRATNAGIEVFVTCDQNIAFQQNISGRQIAVVVLATNRWAVMRGQPGAVENAVANAKPGACSVVTFGRSRRRRLTKP